MFLLTKQSQYYYDGDAIREPAEWARWGKQTTKKTAPGRNMPDRTKEEIQEQFGGTRNARTVWSIPTKPFKGAHFATMPPQLVERCLLATAPRHVCMTCGAPRIRMVKRKETGFDGEKYGERAVAATGGAISGGTQKSTLGSGNGKMTAQFETTGWTDCGCHAGFRPGLVLDPFAGSGTTLLVAKQLRLDAVGIELNPEYVQLAQERLHAIEDDGMLCA